MGIEAVESIAVFGLWYEQHQMNKVTRAAYEERRLGWLDDIVELWIAEHRSEPGLVVDTTTKLYDEVDTLLEKLVDVELLDVPQILNLKLSRLSDYLDEQAAFWSRVLQTLVEASASHDGWRLDVPSSYDATQEVLTGAEAETRSSSKTWLLSVLGLGAFCIPLFGPAVVAVGTIAGGLGGGLLGGGVGSALDKRTARKRTEVLRRHQDLLRLLIAIEQVGGVLDAVDRFLSEQEIPPGYHLYGRGRNGGDLQLLLGPERSRSLLRRIVSPQGAPQLRTLPKPVEVCDS
jgi:hypothetical protein